MKHSALGISYFDALHFLSIFARGQDELRYWAR